LPVCHNAPQATLTGFKGAAAWQGREGAKGIGYEGGHEEGKKGGGVGMERRKRNLHVP